jgi:hypothetical protein
MNFVLVQTLLAVVLAQLECEACRAYANSTLPFSLTVTLDSDRQWLVSSGYPAIVCVKPL